MLILRWNNEKFYQHNVTFDFENAWLKQNIHFRLNKNETKYTKQLEKQSQKFPFTESMQDSQNHLQFRMSPLEYSSTLTWTDDASECFWHKFVLVNFLSIVIRRR